MFVNIGISLIQIMDNIICVEFIIVFTFYVFFNLQVLCQHLLSFPSIAHDKPMAKPAKMIAKEAQMVVARLLREQLIKHHETLSLDLLNNGLMALCNMNALHKEKR